LSQGHRHVAADRFAVGIGLERELSGAWSAGGLPDGGAWPPPEKKETAMRIGAVLVVIWLVIGLFAATQRHYFSGSNTSCAKLGTIAVTTIAGPLNYVGVNPKVNCQVSA
jgi:hypothetical protein